MRKIGITTTVPIEVLIAAGGIPVDLNNLFVTSKDPISYIHHAERDGFPKSMCAWIKGIYGVCMAEGITEVVGVIEGDCSNTKSLLEIFALKGIKLYPFSYPHGREREKLAVALEDFMQLFGVTPEVVERVRVSLAPIRQFAARIDELTVSTGQATSFENHLYQVALSDLGGEGLAFRNTIEAAYKSIVARPHRQKPLRLAYLGVPPMTSDLYDFIDTHEGIVVYNEVQHEFAFPRAMDAQSMVDHYLDYTYPYDSAFRVNRIQQEIAKREVHGVIHYTQAFCHRAMDDIILKHHIQLPILHIEGDTSSSLDARTKLRIEAFMDMLHDQKAGVTWVC